MVSVDKGHETIGTFLATQLTLLFNADDKIDDVETSICHHVETSGTRQIGVDYLNGCVLVEG